VEEQRSTSTAARNDEIHAIQKTMNAEDAGIPKGARGRTPQSAPLLLILGAG